MASELISFGEFANDKFKGMPAISDSFTIRDMSKLYEYIVNQVENCELDLLLPSLLQFSKKSIVLKKEAVEAFEDGLITSGEVGTVLEDVDIYTNHEIPEMLVKKLATQCDCRRKKVSSSVMSEIEESERRAKGG